MTGQKLLVERGAVTRLTLNRPELGNVVDDESLELLASALQEVARDDSCRVLALTGAGEKFCVGREHGGAQLGPGPSAYARRTSLDRITAVNDALRAVAAVSVAAVNGDALGFGCGLAAQCDLTLAAAEARFGFPEIDSGLPPTIVMSYLGRYAPRKRVAELVLTGRRLSAREAEAVGLVNCVVQRAELDREVAGLLETLLAKDGFALRTAKQFLSETQDMTVEQASRYGVNLLSVVLSAKD